MTRTGGIELSFEKNASIGQDRFPINATESSMPALLIVDIEVRDLTDFCRYTAAAPDVIKNSVADTLLYAEK